MIMVVGVQQLLDVPFLLLGSHAKVLMRTFSGDSGELNDCGTELKVTQPVSTYKEMVWNSLSASRLLTTEAGLCSIT